MWGVVFAFFCCSTVVEATLLAATVGNGNAAVMAMAHNNAAP